MSLRSRLKRARVKRRFWQHRIVQLKRLIAARKVKSSGALPPTKITLTSVKRWLTRPPIKPNLIVLHDTESPAHSGLSTSQYLARGSVQADVHIVIDVDGTTYRLVPDGRKAWHVVNYNSRAQGIEQIGYASQTSWPDAQLRATAAWIAYWSKKYNIPIVDARSTLTRGVVTHSSLGAAGGGHHDPGAGYPFKRVIQLAKEIA